MPWQRLQNLDSDLDPTIENVRKKLANSIRVSLGASTKLDRIEIVRQQGRKGYTAIGAGIGVDPQDESLDPDEGAAQLIAMAQEHADAHGAALYQAVAIGETQRGQPTTHWKIAIDLREGPEVDREHYTEGLDVLRASKQMIEALVGTNGTLLANMASFADKMREQVEVSIKAQANLVELRKVELEHADKHAERQATYDLERMRDERIRAGVGRLWDDLGPQVGDVFGAYMHDMRTRAHTKSDGGSSTGGSIPTELATILEPITAEQRGKIETILGVDLVDLIYAASKAPSNDEAKAILHKAAEITKAWPKAKGMAAVASVAQVLGDRGAMLFAFLRKHA